MPKQIGLVLDNQLNYTRQIEALESRLTSMEETLTNAIVVKAVGK